MVEGSLKVQKAWVINEEKAAARKLQVKIGADILQDRRDFMTYREIAAKNDLVKKSGLGRKCMSPLVHHVLHGYDGDNPLPAIIDKKEAKYIVSEIRKRLYSSTLGNRTKEERVAASSKSGTVCYEKGVGIFGRDAETISKDSMKGGAASAIKRGQAPWETGEKLLVHILYKSGVYGRKDIVPIVNKLWDNDRTALGVGCQETRFKKSYTGLENISS